MANIKFSGFCKDCNWPLLFVCCNDEMGTKKPYSEHDWWKYCTNKGCKNHKGEGIFQNRCSFQKIMTIEEATAARASLLEW